jgi:carboxylesterase type B
VSRDLFEQSTLLLILIRWRAPQPIPPTKPGTVFNATQYGATCPQAISGTLYTQQNEDCLNLNVWAPAKGSNLPVFIYMYGGAMVTGSSSNPQFQGQNFARKDVIFVSFNTRESIFAYPNSAELGKTESQNFGILDVEKALEWVQRNIAGPYTFLRICRLDIILTYKCDSFWW